MKKLILTILALTLCLALCGCDADAAYQELLERLAIPSAQQEQPVEEPENKPDEPKQPVDAAEEETLWPEGVPALADCETVISQVHADDGSFVGQYLVSDAQLAAWEEALGKAGFVKTESGYVGGEWAVRLEKAAQSASSKADWRLTVTIEPSGLSSAVPAWPEGFEEFPVYNGDGSYSVEVSVSRDSGPTMVLTAAGETKAGYQRYLKTLESAGFTLIDYVFFSKETAAGLYEVNTDGAWGGDGSVKLTYTVIAKG